MDVAKTLNDERKRLFIVSHPAEKEDHLKNEILFLTHFICLER